MNYTKFISIIPFLSVMALGCDGDPSEPQEMREGEWACFTICPPGEECVTTCVPVGEPTPPSGTDTGTGTDDSSMSTDTGTEDTAGPPPHPCCFENEFDGCIHPSDKAIEQCVHAIRPYCTEPDPELIGWHFKCVWEAQESCGLVC